jgi:hypothetical protein
MPSVDEADCEERQERNRNELFISVISDTTVAT